ncbi:MAG TPA: hypothetical protein VNT02_13500 [Burkholderiales bacterium]|nr:hypothetical protein [Burkholderiales bacterium]
MRLQGTLRALYVPEIIHAYLWSAQVLCKDFKSHLCEVTNHVRAAAATLAADEGRPMLYLRGSPRKERLIDEIRRRDQIDGGLIAVLSAVEPCRTWQVRGDRQERKLRVEVGWGKCIHLYFYLVHEVFGLMHLRLQTWFPFLVQICLNGREWLGRQMDAAGIGYRREDNCYTHIDDLDGAQRLMDEQQRTNWENALSPLIAQCHPTHELIQRIVPVDYYWTAAETEHATDIMFKDREDLERIYRPLVHHSMMSFGAEQVLGFLGRKAAGKSEVTTDRRRREPGVRVKHWVDENSLKLYDKGSVLRSEVTINEPTRFKVYRAAEGSPQGPKAWRQLRRTVADLSRRAQVSRAASDRHLGALAAVETDTPLQDTIGDLCRRVTRHGKRYRALRVFDSLDHAALTALNRAEWTISGLRNADLREALREHLPRGLTEKQISARISRLLRLLRAHGLIAKVARTRRYHVTGKARTAITALLAAAKASTPALTRLAA